MSSMKRVNGTTPTWPAVSEAPERVGCTEQNNRPEPPRSQSDCACGWPGDKKKKKDGRTEQCEQFGSKANMLSIKKIPRPAKQT